MKRAAATRTAMPEQLDNAIGRLREHAPGDGGRARRSSGLFRKHRDGVPANGHYEERRPGWGRKLFDAVGHTIELILAHPEIGEGRPGRNPSR